MNAHTDFTLESGSLATRVAQLEAEFQRVREEVEACSVLVLSLDASAQGANALAVGRRTTFDNHETHEAAEVKAQGCQTNSLFITSK